MASSKKAQPKQASASFLTVPFCTLFAADACFYCYYLFLGAINPFKSMNYRLKREVLMVKREELTNEKRKIDEKRRTIIVFLFT